MIFPATSTHPLWQRVGFLASLAAGLVLGVAVPAHAQFSTSADALESPTDGPNDVFRAGEDDLRTPFDLYHRANLANSRSPEEFLQQQRSALGSEIENLRMQQQQLLQGQPAQPEVTEPTTEEPSIDAP